MADDDIRVGAGGRVEGIDGMVDQVTSSATRAVRVELWPAIEASTVPERLGRAQGDALGRRLQRWAAVGACAAVAGALVALAAELRVRRERREAEESARGW